MTSELKFYFVGATGVNPQNIIRNFCSEDTEKNMHSSVVQHVVLSAILHNIVSGIFFLFNFFGVLEILLK